MMDIFKIEFKKMFKQKKTYIVWFFMVTMLLTSIHMNSLDIDHFNSLNYDDPRLLDQSIDILKKQNDILNNNLLNTSAKDSLKKTLSSLKKSIDNLKVIQNSKSSYMDKLKAKIAIMESEKNGSQEGTMSGSPVYQYDKELRYLRYLYDNKIPEYSYPVYNSYNSILNFLIHSSSAIIIIILIVILSSDIISREIDESTIKLLLIQPVSRLKVLIGKYFALIVSILILIFSSFAALFIIEGIKDGIGNPSYPILINVKYSSSPVKDSMFSQFDGNSGYFINYITMLFILVLFFALVCITAASISFMISSFINKSVLSISVNIIITFGLSYLINNTNILNSIKQYIYISYASSTEVFTGKIVSTLQNENINIFTGIIVMIMTILISLFISCKAFVKKEI